MPEFILNRARDKGRFDNLSELARGYVEAMFFTNCDSGDEREDLANQLGVGRLTRDSIKSIRRDCERFESTIMPDGCFVRQWLDRLPDYSDAQAGRDFWFTRQGHGVGFWDRDELTGDVGDWFASIEAPAQWSDERRRQFLALRGKSFGDHLSNAARSMGEVYPQIYRGWIYYR